MLRWRVGDVVITKILEAEGQAPLAMFPDATVDRIRAASWLCPHFANEAGDIFGSVHAFVVETPARRIVVDTCCGNDKDRAASAPHIHMLQTAFLGDLVAAGFSREAIDTVLCTHLHFDHVGWNTMLIDGRWVPTFPNARYLIARAEFEQWGTQAGIDAQVFADSVQPIVDAGLADMVDTDVRLCPEVSLVHTPGHTRGHVSVRIQSRGEQALITGDFMHHPCQIAWPEWSTIFDTDQAQARATRSRLLAELADTPTLVLGTHFVSPTAGRIVRDGDSFRLCCE